MPSLTRNIVHGSEQARNILRECQTRIRNSQRDRDTKLAKWSEAEDKAMAYIPEREVDRLKKNARTNSGLQDYTTIQIPYSYAVLMSAHTYLTSVFLARSPIFQFQGRHGEPEMSVQALEALIDYQMLVGEMLVPINIWLYDAVKYGVGVGEIYWEERVENITTIEEEPQIDPYTGMEIGPPQKIQTTQQVISYSGNRFCNVQPQDFLWDTRYPAWAFQKGEYCAKRFAMNWNEVIRRMHGGYYIESTVAQLKAKYTGDQFGPNQVSSLERPETTDPNFQTWELSENYGADHASMVKGYEVHIELIPSEWGLGGSDAPEKWVFTCTGDFSFLLGVQPLGAYHCKFPYSVLCLEPEAYGIVSRGMPEILEPVQQTVDWLINSHFYNVRQTLNNMFIFDPSRIVLKDILNPKPGKMIRLHPSAYGTDPKLAITQFQTQDVTQNHLRDLQMMLGIGERTVGINDQIMGMLNAGGRKTATEVRTSTSFGVNRLKTISEFFGISGFDPLSRMLTQNTQQYFDQEIQLRVAGELMSTATTLITATPETIAGFYDFVPIDGTLPIDRYAQMNVWMNLFGQIQRMPQIMMQYDLGRIFEYVAQLGGIKNIGQFRVELGSPQYLQNQAMMGNVIPMNRGAAGGGKKPTPSSATSPEPGQIPGMGATG